MQYKKCGNISFVFILLNYTLNWMGQWMIKWLKGNPTETMDIGSSGSTYEKRVIIQAKLEKSLVLSLSTN